MDLIRANQPIRWESMGNCKNRNKKDKKVGIIVNGLSFEVSEGENLLETLLSLGFKVPHMCYHKAFSPYGSCRLCIVEIKVNGDWRVFTSCNLEVKDGMVVRTESEKLDRLRKKLMDLMGDFCSLCGLCVRVCQAGILYFEGKGIGRRVKSVVHSCLGCMSCVNLCPQNAIEFDLNLGITLGDDVLAKPEMRKCKCGNIIGGEKQLKEIEEKTGIKVELCEECRKRNSKLLELWLNCKNNIY